MLNKPYITFYSLAVVFSIFQYLIFDRLSIYGLTPDFLTIFVVYFGIREGQMSGMTFGFFVGIVLGLFSGTLGAAALAKTLEGFVGGLFSSTDEKNLTFNLFVSIAVASIIGNLVYYYLMQSHTVSILKLIFLFGLGGSLYNLLIGYIIYHVGLKRLLA